MAPLISSPAAVSYGAPLTFENLTSEVSLRFRPLEDTLLRVIDGVAELRFDGEEHLLGPGGEAIVPAGFHHTLCAVSAEARIVTVRSIRTEILTAGGSAAWSCGRSFFTRSTTSMMLAPGWRWIFMITAG